LAADLGQEKRSGYPESASSGQGEKSLLGKSKKPRKQSLTRSVSGASPQDGQGLLAFWGLCTALISARGSAGAAREDSESDYRH